MFIVTNHMFGTEMLTSFFVIVFAHFWQNKSEQLVFKLGMVCCPQGIGCDSQN